MYEVLRHKSSMPLLHNDLYIERSPNRYLDLACKLMVTRSDANNALDPCRGITESQELK